MLFERAGVAAPGGGSVALLEFVVVAGCAVRLVCGRATASPHLQPVTAES